MAVTEKGKAKKANAPSVVESKGVAKKDEAAEKLRAKARAASQLASGNMNAAQGFNYLSLCQSMTKAKKKSYPDLYIKDLKDGDFFLQNKKLILGESVDFVPLAFFQIYQEYVTDPQVNKDAKMVGIWTPEDAEQLDPQFGKQWNRETLDGHILCPAWWVFGYLPDFPEEERVVITFKSTGNKVGRAWFKDASKAAPDTPFSLVYELTSTEEVNGNNSWGKIVPTLKSRVFTLDKNGDIDEVVEDYAETVIDRDGAINKAFADGRLVQKHAVKAAKNPRRANDDDYSSGDDADSYDDADENGTPEF